MNQPLVSIALVTYMHERYIKDCLESLIGQTYHNIELLILDDASTDSTYDIIMSYEWRMRAKFSNVLILKNDHNSRNVSANLNKLLKESKGIYFKTFSGDDAMFPTYVEDTVTFLEQSENRDAILVYTNAYIVADDYRLGDGLKGKCFYQRYRPYPKNELYEGLLRRNNIVAPSVLMRRRVLEQYGFYDEEIPFEDYDLWLRLAHKERFAYLSSKLIYYRRAETSLTNYQSKDGRDKLIFMLLGGRKVIQKNIAGLSKEKKQIYQQIFYESYLRTAYQSGFWGIAIQILVFMWRKKYYVRNEIYLEMVQTAKEAIEEKIKCKNEKGVLLKTWKH